MSTLSSRRGAMPSATGDPYPITNHQAWQVLPTTPPSADGRAWPSVHETSSSARTAMLTADPANSQVGRKPSKKLPPTPSSPSEDRINQLDSISMPKNSRTETVVGFGDILDRSAPRPSIVRFNSNVIEETYDASTYDSVDTSPASQPSGTKPLSAAAAIGILKTHPRRQMRFVERPNEDTWVNLANHGNGDTSDDDIQDIVSHLETLGNLTSQDDHLTSESSPASFSFSDMLHDMQSPPNLTTSSSLSAPQSHISGREVSNISSELSLPQVRTAWPTGSSTSLELGTPLRTRLPVRANVPLSPVASVMSEGTLKPPHKPLSTDFYPYIPREGDLIFSPAFILAPQDDSTIIVPGNKISDQGTNSEQVTFREGYTMAQSKDRRSLSSLNSHDDNGELPTIPPLFTSMKVARVDSATLPPFEYDEYIHENTLPNPQPVNDGVRQARSWSEPEAVTTENVVRFEQRRPKSPSPSLPPLTSNRKVETSGLPAPISSLRTFRYPSSSSVSSYPHSPGPRDNVFTHNLKPSLFPLDTSMSSLSNDSSYSTNSTASGASHGPSLSKDDGKNPTRHTVGHSRRDRFLGSAKRLLKGTSKADSVRKPEPETLPELDMTIYRSHSEPTSVSLLPSPIITFGRTSPRKIASATSPWQRKSPTSPSLRPSPTNTASTAYTTMSPGSPLSNRDSPLKQTKFSSSPVGHEMHAGASSLPMLSPPRSAQSHGRAQGLAGLRWMRSPSESMTNGNTLHSEYGKSPAGPSFSPIGEDDDDDEGEVFSIRDTSLAHFGSTKRSTASLRTAASFPTLFTHPSHTPVIQESESLTEVQNKRSPKYSVTSPSAASTLLSATSPSSLNQSAADWRVVKPNTQDKEVPNTVIIADLSATSISDPTKSIRSRALPLTPHTDVARESTTSTPVNTYDRPPTNAAGAMRGSRQSISRLRLKSAIEINAAPVNRDVSTSDSLASPTFESVPVRWKGMTLDQAKWTFNSGELQKMVGRAIKHSSAEVTAIRLLDSHVLEVELPEEVERLETERDALKAKYGHQIRVRNLLLRSLDLYVDGSDVQTARRLLRDLLDVSATCESLGSRLHVVIDQLNQIQELRGQHLSSTLVMALHKLNTGFLRSSKKADEYKIRLASMEIEKEQGWGKAYELEQELDNLRGQPPGPSSPVLKIHKEGLSKRWSRVSAARKSVARSSTQSLRYGGMVFPRPPTPTWSQSQGGTTPSPPPPIPILPPDLASLARIPNSNSNPTFTSEHAYPHNIPITPSSAARAMFQAQNEVLEILGLSTVEIDDHGYFGHVRSHSDTLRSHIDLADAAPTRPTSLVLPPSPGFSRRHNPHTELITSQLPSVTAADTLQANNYDHLFRYMVSQVQTP